MKFGSLFSGVGGFDLGFERSGLVCEWQVEIDKDCQRVLKRHWPNVERFEDVSTVGKLGSVDVICGGFPCQDLSVAGKRAGLAGERSGLWFEFLRVIELNHPRWVVIENVPGLLSSWSPVELPPDAVEGREWDVEENSDFEIILTGLADIGYCVSYRILDAQFDGVAQRRERVFIVGSFGDGSCAEVLFESESVSWNPPTRRETGTGVAATITERFAGGSNQWAPMNEADNLQVFPIQEVGARESKNQNGVGIGIGKDQDVMYTLQSGQIHGVAMPLKAKANSSHDESHETYVTHTLRAEGADAGEDGTGRGTPLVVATLNSGGNNGGFRSEPGEHLIATAYRTAGNCGPFEQGDKTGALNCATDPNQNIIAFSSKDGGADAGEIAPTLRSQNFKDSHMNGGGQVAIAFAENQRGEIRTSDVSPQLSCSGGKPGSGYSAMAGGFGVRRLTPTECMRLQGFPDWWFDDENGKKLLSDSSMYRCLGNAVCVNVAEWIGKRFVKALLRKS